MNFVKNRELSSCQSVAVYFQSESQVKRFKLLEFSYKISDCSLYVELYDSRAELPVGVEGLSVDNGKEIVDREESRDDYYDRTNAAHVYCAFYPEAYC